MPPLFFNVDSNKLRGNVKNEITLICAKFGADLINISKVTRRKTRCPRFFAPSCMCWSIISSPNQLTFEIVKRCYRAVYSNYLDLQLLSFFVHVYLGALKMTDMKMQDKKI